LVRKPAERIARQTESLAQTKALAAFAALLREVASRIRRGSIGSVLFAESEQVEQARPRRPARTMSLSLEKLRQFFAENLGGDD